MSKMSTKNLRFDAVEVKSSSTNSNNHISVEIETCYPNEVLENFTPEEIIQEYSDLDNLFDALMEHFLK